MGERGLRLAAAHADIVGPAGGLQVPDQPSGAFTVADTAMVDERVGVVREVAAAHGRDPELDVLLQRVVLDAEPEQTAAAMVREAPGVSCDLRGVRRAGAGRSGPAWRALPSPVGNGCSGCLPGRCPRWP